MSNIVKAVKEFHLSLDDDPPSRRKLTKEEEERRQRKREALKVQLIQLMLQKKAQA